MKITMSPEQLSSLKDFLTRFEDCEALSEKEYVIDLFDIEPPMSIDMTLAKNAIFVDGAAELLFDDEMDGWYIGKRIEEPEAVLEALRSVGAVSQ